ncbi:MAG: hypothetical protein NC078_01630 [Ruminococcus sp.]|nr:hypothetical protein [Ruminococcus sp.]
MRGNTISEFMNDLLTMGGPEKEFVFKDKRYFLETVYNHEKQLNEMMICEISDGQDSDSVKVSFWGKDFFECVEQFEDAKLFDGMTIYEAENEIEVIYG